MFFRTTNLPNLSDNLLILWTFYVNFNHILGSFLAKLLSTRKSEWSFLLRFCFSIEFRCMKLGMNKAIHSCTQCALSRHDWALFFLSIFFMHYFSCTLFLLAFCNLCLIWAFCPCFKEGFCLFLFFLQVFYLHYSTVYYHQ